MNFKISIVIFLVFIAGLVGYYIYIEDKDRNTSPGTPQIVSKEIISPETVEQIEGEQEIVQKKSTPIPDLERPIIISGSSSEEQKEQITSKIKELAALLKQDADLFNEWISWGLLRKSIDDYEGAREAWEYAGIIRPQNSLSFSNLGVLYGYYLQNSALAEKNYLKAIENDPKYPYYYVQTADFYIEVLKDSKKAEEVLKKGFKEMPGDGTIKAALDDLATRE